MPDGNESEQIDGYREGLKTSQGLKKQPAIETAEQILNTYVENKTSTWKAAWKEGFWDGVRDNTQFEDMRGGMKRD